MSSETLQNIEALFRDNLDVSLLIKSKDQMLHQDTRMQQSSRN